MESRDPRLDPAESDWPTAASTEALLVNHPEMVRQLLAVNNASLGRGRFSETLRYLLGMGLVTADCPLHMRWRRRMQPQFHRRPIEGYGEKMELPRFGGQFWT